MNRYLEIISITLIFSVVILTGCKKNKAPDMPSIPAGPTSGGINTEYTFTSSAEDLDDDSVAIRFIWGDEDTSNWSSFVPSGDSISMSHSWSDSGTYSIKAQAQDLKEAVSSWSSGHQIMIGTTIPTNYPPNTPTTPRGASFGSPNFPCSFISTATDPEEDSIAIRFDWGDDSISDWSDWQASGDSVSMSHSWSDAGTYNIKAQAKDKKDTTSIWSAGHQIKILASWIKTFGGTDDDRGYSVQSTMDGGYIITGYTESYGAGGEDVYLIKTDEYGDTIWTRAFGGSADDEGLSVQATTDGGYIIAGHTWSFGSGLNDFYLIKTDANGNETWYKTFGGSGNEHAHSVQQTSDGGYIITGYTNSYGAHSDDVWLIKTNANGIQSWAKRFGRDVAGNFDYSSSVQQTSDGGYIIVGATNSYGQAYQVYLIKTDANGDTIWTRTYGGSERESGNSVQQTSDGGYIIAGYTDSYGGDSTDVYLIKTDANGNQQWYKTFGGINDDGSRSVQQTIDGGYIIIGYTKSYGAGDYDVYLIKTNANGDKLWDKTFGGSGDDKGYSIRRHYDNYIITGYTKSSGAGGADVYLIRTDANGNVE